MMLKILVKTPKGQAAKCIKSQKDTLLGLKKANSVKEQKVVNDRLFYWVIPIKDDQELKKVQQRLALGEVMIKKFYKQLIKVITKANKYINKFKKGYKAVKWFLIKLVRKQMQDERLIEDIRAMDEEAIKDFLIMHDYDEMQELLKEELITTQTIDKNL